MLTYEEKKPDLTDREKKERLEIIQLLKESFLLFKIAYDEQTNKFEKASNGIPLDISGVGDVSARIESLTNVSKYNNENETIMAFVEEREKRPGYLDFDGIINQIVCYI